MNSRVFLPFAAAALFLLGCVIITRPVSLRSRDARLAETRAYIENEVGDPGRQGRLVRSSAHLAARVGQLNAFDEQVVSRMTLLGSSPEVSDSVIRSAARSVRSGREPLLSGMADALFEMKAAADPYEWQPLARIAFSESVEAMAMIGLGREHLLEILVRPAGTKKEFLEELRKLSRDICELDERLIRERRAANEHMALVD